MHNPNDIDWAKIESEFADGWRYWCARGGLDSGTCLDTQGKRRSFEFRDGFEAAANWNENHGDPPTVDDASDFASDYVAAKQADHVSLMAIYAD